MSCLEKLVNKIIEQDVQWERYRNEIGETSYRSYVSRIKNIDLYFSWADLALYNTWFPKSNIKYYLEANNVKIGDESKEDQKVLQWLYCHISGQMDARRREQDRIANEKYEAKLSEICKEIDKL